MKKVSIVVAVAVMFCLPMTALAQSLNVVYVDLQMVMLESEKGKEAKKSLTDEAEKLKKNLDAKQDELQKLKDAMEKQGAMITSEARAEKDKQYQAKLKDYQRLANDYQGELQQKDMEFTQKILKELEEVVKSMGEKERYSMVLEKSQAGILFGSPSLDVTSKVITLYNEASRKKPATKK
ncbi:MAG: OmpH family outer membrane protein [Syntrophobacterales bacterium]|jgi:outer membrane protein|nr:OmpH family outer membrane protein [Syntrophobacterales bacterium]